MKKMFNNRIGQIGLTKTGMVIMFSIFYGVIFAFIGYAYGTNNPVSTTNPVPSLLSNISNYFSAVITGFANMPIWLSGIVLTPFVAGIIFLMITSLPTMSGGS